MISTTCFADIAEDDLSKLREAVREAKAPSSIVYARLDVVTLSKLSPSLMLCDLDNLEIDPIETLRQLRFVLPAAIIVVYTKNSEHGWTLACHSAGANGLVSKASSSHGIAMGIRSATIIGCFTDPLLIGDATLAASPKRPGFPPTAS